MSELNNGSFDHVTNRIDCTVWQQKVSGKYSVTISHMGKTIKFENKSKAACENFKKIFDQMIEDYTKNVLTYTQYDKTL